MACCIISFKIIICILAHCLNAGIYPKCMLLWIIDTYNDTNLHCFCDFELDWIDSFCAQLKAKTVGTRSEDLELPDFFAGCSAAYNGGRRRPCM